MNDKQNHGVPYSLKMSLAVLSGNQQLADKIMAQCLSEITRKLMDAAHEYDYSDLPFVVGSMRAVANALSLILDDSGKSLSESVARGIDCVAMDVSELLKQINEEDGKEGGRL